MTDRNASLENEINKMNEVIDTLQEKGTQIASEKASDLQNAVEQLQKKRRKVEWELRRLRNAGQAASEELKKGVSLAWFDLKNSFDRVVDRFAA